MTGPKYLTRNKILMGIDYQKDVILHGYGDMVVVVHPVADVPLGRIQEKLNYGIFDALRDLTTCGFTQADVEGMMDNAVDNALLSKLSQISIPAKLSFFLAELCKAGIVPIHDPDCPRCHGKPLDDTPKGVCGDCDIRMVVDEGLKGFSTLELGAAILGVTTSDWKDVEQFFAQKKVACGQELSPENP
jgi:hypothetical protein